MGSLTQEKTKMTSAKQFKLDLKMTSVKQFKLDLKVSAKSLI